MGFEEDYREVDLTFEGGIQESVEDSLLPTGTAPIIRNWEATPAGGLRVRRGWQATATTGLESTGLDARGIGHYPRPVDLYMVPSVIGLGTNSSAAATSITKTLGSYVTTAGNMIIAALSLNTDTVGLTIPANFTLAAASTNGLSRIYYAQNCPALSTNIGTFSWTNSQGVTLYVEEVRNIATTALDVTATNTGTSTTADSGTTAATATPNDYAFVMMRAPSATTFTNSPTNGFTGVFSGNGTGSPNHAFFMAHKFMTAAEAASTSTTMSPSGAWQGVIATFKAALNTDSSDVSGYYVCAVVNSTKYLLYATNRDYLDAASWDLIDSITPSSGNLNDPVAFTTGLSKLLYTNVRFSTARQWDPGNGPSAISGSPPGRCIAFHKSRVFIGGTAAIPTLLYWSDVGSTSFSTGTSGSIYVGREDGEAIEEIIPTEVGLLIGKRNSLWYLTGSGNDNFQLTQLSEGGCAPGRSMERTGYGVVVAGREYVYLVQGSKVEIMSEPIETSYGMTGDWMGTSYRNGRCSVLDQGSGVSWVYDFRRNIWQSEERVGTAAEAPAVIFDHGPNQLFGPSAPVVNGLLAWRIAPNGDRVKDFDTLPETFEAWTPEMWLAGPGAKFTPRYLFLKLRQRVADVTDTPLVITPYYDGTEGAPLEIPPRSETGAFWVRKSIGQKRGISSVQLQFLHGLGAAEDAVFDIEKGILGFNIEGVV